MFLAGSQKLKVRTANVLAWQKYVFIRRQYFIHILFLSQKLDFDRHFHLAKEKYVIKARFDASCRNFHKLVYR